MRRTAAIVATIFLIAAGAHAQVLGTLQGYVTDEQGGVLPGVTVTVSNTETGAERVVVTDSIGFYTAPSLPSGVYSITASLSGMQSSQRDNIRLFVAQVLNVDFNMRVGSVTEEVTVTAESPIIEVSRSDTARYVTDVEIDNLPIADRDFTTFALLQPTVKSEPIRGGISLGGQKGISTGLNIDGTEAKSAFFGYGRGGEATENDGLVISQDAVKEFQVLVNGFAPEYGRNGGGYLNVITRSGTNQIRGRAFWLFRNEGLASDLKPTDLDESRGLTGDEDQFQVSEFKRQNFGLSLGGPIVKNQTHFFVSFDRLDRDEPFVSNIRGRGQYDAVLQRYPSLLRGFTGNGDGTAEPDPENGQTASGQFERQVDNQIFFGKITQQFGQNNTFAIRYNYTDYERTSDRKSEESLKAQKTHSVVASLVSVIGSNKVNEFRVQWAKDSLDRLSNLEPGDIPANFRIFNPSFGSFGKPDFLPIYVREKKLQLQNNFTWSLENHDIKFGVDWNQDDLSEFFAGSFDGRYDFNSIDDFLANEDLRVRIFFGEGNAPAPGEPFTDADENFAVKQTTLAFYGQDTWRPNNEVTVNFGLRWEGTYNPSGLEHVLPEGRQIPNDTNNIAPRFGVTWSPGGDGKQVFRFGGGKFYSRTPTLIFFDVVQSNGFAPGRTTVSPGQTGHVPLGEDIDNNNPPEGITPSVGIVEQDFEDPETWRFNAGYEREFAPNWAANLDFGYNKSSKLQSSYNVNAAPPGRDEFGRPVYSGERLDPNFVNIGTRDTSSRSEYWSLSAGITKRMSDGFQMQAHYTYSQDKSNDDNERSATSVTLTDYTDPDYDWGISSRKRQAPLRVQHRGGAAARVPGVGDRYVPVRRRVHRLRSRPQRHEPPLDHDQRARGGRRSGARAQLVPPDRGSRTWTSVSPSSSASAIRCGFQLLAELFNAFNFSNDVVTGATNTFYNSDGVTPNPEFGIAGGRAGGPVFGNQRQWQLGARLLF